MNVNQNLITRQAVAAQNRSGKLQVSGKLKAAIDRMVWEGSRRPDAAKAAGMTDHGLREAFKKPHVKAYYLGQLEVLRTSERARNILRLAEIRDQDDNRNAAVAAIKALEAIEDDMPAGGGRQFVPGLVIVIEGAPCPAPVGQPVFDAGASHVLPEGE